ncbi:MAG: hypothetical protein U0Y96_14830 [Candidatus Kapaibacterium sp.]|nr:hypothetical protein [Bacteroidota bacterium]
MQELTDLADKLKATLKIKYDSDGVKFVEGFIERNKVQIAKEEWTGLINSCGAFLGQCIIENYGGQWTKEDSGHVAIAFDDKNKVYPFSKVGKQFDNGLEDSIHSMYTIIPTIFKIQPKTKKKWWQF